MLALLELCDVDELAARCVDFFHFFYFRFKFVLHVAHHFALLLHLSLFLEVLLEVVRNRHGVIHVLTMHERTEHFLLADDTVSEGIELRSAVSDLLRSSLWFMHEDLAIRKIAPDLLADHHGQLVNGQLCRRPIVPPVVIVRSADGVKLVWVLLFDSLSPHLPSNL